MLVLSRQVNERIMVGGGIVITVVRIDEDKVRLGIDAPPGVAIDREEIYDAKRREGQDGERAA